MTDNSTMTAAGYVVVDNEAIWGLGETADAAWADMVDGMSRAGVSVVDEFETDDRGDYPDQTLASNFKIVPATAALLALVEAHGGAIAWRQCDGVACTKAEYEG